MMHWHARPAAFPHDIGQALRHQHNHNNHNAPFKLFHTQGVVSFPLPTPIAGSSKVGTADFFASEERSGLSRKEGRLAMPEVQQDEVSSLQVCSRNAHARKQELRVCIV